MVAAKNLAGTGDESTTDETLFARIAQDLQAQGYSICPLALPLPLANTLYHHQQTMDDEKYSSAGIGRGQNYLTNGFIRSDEICWITGESAAGRAWLSWTDKLKSFVNRRLFLGLFSFESHFAHYAPGDFYKRHYDAFRGEANRVLTIVVYLNPGWLSSDGGELILYRDDDDKEGIRVLPMMGTIAVFLSEEFPHEVVPANRDRYSIAGWFRVNTSVSDRVDPPL